MSVQRSMDGRTETDVIIVGAGMAGLSCASHLKQQGIECRLFDKGRGPGGRMATRRVDLDGEQLRFDHGAQYFTARNPDFCQAVQAWEQAGVVAKWPAAGDDAWVGTPAMNAPIKAIATDHDVTWSARVDGIERRGDSWSVPLGNQDMQCQHLLLAIPPEQAAVLLADVAPELAARAGQVTSLPCWAAMASFSDPLSIEGDTFRSEKGPISWAARNSAKPGRDGPESWVIHASPERTRELLDGPKEEAAELLLADFFEALGHDPAKPTYLTAHRWLYAMPRVEEQGSAIWDAALGIGLAGDWLHSPRVEGAWLSGKALAERAISR